MHTYMCISSCEYINCGVMSVNFRVKTFCVDYFYGSYDRRGCNSVTHMCTIHFVCLIIVVTIFLTIKFR